MLGGQSGSGVVASLASRKTRLIGSGSIRLIASLTVPSCRLAITDSFIEGRRTLGAGRDHSRWFLLCDAHRCRSLFIVRLQQIELCQFDGAKSRGRSKPAAIGLRHRGAPLPRRDKCAAPAPAGRPGISIFGTGPRLGPGHALLTATLAAPVLPAFQIVFLRHRNFFLCLTVMEDNWNSFPPHKETAPARGRAEAGQVWGVYQVWVKAAGSGMVPAYLIG
jgi:hypothetical protein